MLPRAEGLTAFAAPDALQNSDYNFHNFGYLPGRAPQPDLRRGARLALRARGQAGLLQCAPLPRSLRSRDDACAPIDGVRRARCDRERCAPEPRVVRADLAGDARRKPRCHEGVARGTADDGGEGPRATGHTQAARTAAEASSGVITEAIRDGPVSRRSARGPRSHDRDYDVAPANLSIAIHALLVAGAKGWLSLESVIATTMEVRTHDRLQ